MAKSTRSDYHTSYVDDDSGLSADFDNGSSTDLNSSISTFIESPPAHMSSPTPTVFKKQDDPKALVRVASDARIERFRPATMRNSENADYVLCQTDRGAYVAYRTPVVPDWIKRLVEEVEAREQ